MNKQMIQRQEQWGQGYSQGGMKTMEKSFNYKEAMGI